MTSQSVIARPYAEAAISVAKQDNSNEEWSSYMQKIKETAESDIAQSTNKAKETLKEELSVLVVAGASKILNKEIDESANKEIVDQLIKEL
jgi:F-type H+-transporting ATPase subunit b